MSMTCKSFSDISRHSAQGRQGAGVSDDDNDAYSRNVRKRERNAHRLSLQEKHLAISTLESSFRTENAYCNKCRVLQWPWAEHANYLCVLRTVCNDLCASMWTAAGVSIVDIMSLLTCYLVRVFELIRIGRGLYRVWG